MGFEQDSGSVIHAGYVMMNGKLGLIKQRRYLALDEDLQAICICKNEKQLSNRRTHPLEGMETAFQDGLKFVLRYAESAPPPNSGRVVTYFCKSEEEAADWAAAVLSQLAPGGSSSQSSVGPSDSPRKASLPAKVGDALASPRKSGPARTASLVLKTASIELEDSELTALVAATVPLTEARAGDKHMSNLSERSCYIADLEYFQFLGGVVPDNNNLLWIAEKPPKGRTPRMLGSSMFFNRLSLPLPTSSPKGRKSSRTKPPISRPSVTKARPSPRAKSERQKPAEEPSKQPGQAPAAAAQPAKAQTKPINPEREGLSKLIEKNMMDKSTGKNAKSKALLPGPAPAAKSTRFGGMFRKGAKKSPAVDEAGDSSRAAPAKPQTKEQIKEKIARQARLAGGGEYNTGAATIGLGEEIAKSKLAQTLAERKAALAKKQEAEKKKLAKQKPEDGKPQKVHTLASFLKEVEGDQPAPEASPELAESNEPSSSQKPPAENRLAEFLSATGGATEVVAGEDGEDDA